MRSIFKAFPLVAAFIGAVLATPLATDLDIVATAAFPSTNPFANVVNGERNKMSLEIENKSTVNVTLKSAAGSIHDPESGKLLKNTTTLTYGVTLISGAKTILPYNFHSEYKPREVQLKIWVNYDDGQPSGLHHTMAYDSLVTIIEPPASWFDPALIFSVLVLLGVVSGLGYLGYERFVPKQYKRKAKKVVKKDEISSPVSGTVKASGKAYDEAWIPAHNVKKRAAKKDGGVASSGDESGAERRQTRRTASQKS